MGRAIPTSCHVNGILRITSPNWMPKGMTAMQWLCTDTDAPAPCFWFPLILFSVISWTSLETRKCNWYSSMGPKVIQLTHWGRYKMTTIFQTTFFKCIYLNENVWIPIKISLKIAPKGPINNIPALVQIMAWRRPGDKPLSEPMAGSFLTYICGTRPQWVNATSSRYFLRSTHGRRSNKQNCWIRARFQYLECASNGDTTV